MIWNYLFVGLIGFVAGAAFMLIILVLYLDR